MSAPSKPIPPPLPPGVSQKATDKYGNWCRYKWLWPITPEFIEVRYDGKDKVGNDVKTFLPWIMDDAGKWTSNFPPGLRPLFGTTRLPAELGQAVYIVEGPKCASALHSLGLACVTSPAGAQSASKANWTPLQNYKNIIILSTRARGRATLPWHFANG